MASELPNSSESDVVFNEFEEFEVAEFDEDTLRELLGEPEEQVEDNDFISQSKEAPSNGHSTEMEKSGYYENIEPYKDTFEWVETMETSPDMACSDFNPWYTYGSTAEEIIIGISEMRDSIDNSQNFNALQMDEISYVDLWQDN